MTIVTQTGYPTCVGFIMDGNRRWATERGLPTLDGHTAGVQVFLASIEWVRTLHINHAIYYAFSTENWKRSNVEVEYLLELFAKALTEIPAVRVRFIGERTRFNQSLQEKMAAIETNSLEYIEAPTIWIALSYGGRAEIVAAANTAIVSGIPVDEATFGALLWTAGMPDPDLIIRTGGALRLSNFLPWQSVYSELMFTNTYWPAFTKEEFTRMLAQYDERTRRFGR